jgi:signal transduction histidine kinase
MSGFLQTFFSAGDFMPHGHCYLWQPEMVWLQVVSNGLIGLAYVAISLTLVYLVYQIRNIPFQWIYLAFGLFIISCGFTHFLDIWTVWRPYYWLDGTLRALTALASVGTACALPRLVPKAVALAQAAKAAHDQGIQLATAYQQLGEVFEKTKEIDKLKTQFFANVSHELRTPLTLILGPAEILMAAPNLTDAQRHSLDVVQRNARMLLKHVNDLLDVAKLEAGRMLPNYTETDLAELSRVTATNFDSLAAERRISFHLELPARLNTQVDPDMIQRVLLNLLSNAFKFVPDGGHIQVSLRRDNGTALLSVQDDGPGIPPHQREIIFERFRQGDGDSARQFGGTGLGLAIAKEFVELHRGRIEVADAPGRGALFTAKIPVAAPMGVHVQPAAETAIRAELTRLAIEDLRAITLDRESLPASFLSDKAHILIVEDNRDMARFIASSLASEFRITLAFNGQAGFEQAYALRPDLIISDVMMPGMSGDQMVGKIRLQNELDNIPIILLTAKADDALRVRLLREGAQDYVIKPYLMEELIARAKNLVTMKRAREVLQRELASQVQDLEALALEVTAQRLELQQAAQALRIARDEAERSGRVKDRFLGLVSHEVRTPLTALQLQLELFKRSAAATLTETQKGMVDRLFLSSKRSLEIMDSLLEYTRIQSDRITPKVELADLSHLMADAVDFYRPYAADRGIALTGHVSSPSLPPLKSDPTLIRSILRNLVGNALKFTTEGSVDVTAEYAKGVHRIIVKDTGPGIPSEELKSIFEPFYQLTPLEKKHKAGFGLGLSIAKELMTALKGKIEVESTLGQGSTFIATFASGSGNEAAEASAVVG